MNTFHCAFLGCKVNQYDAERARQFLLEHGLRESEERAALLLLASCTVTGMAAKKGRQAVRSLLRRHSGARVVVLGCLTEADRSFYQGLEAPVTILPSARDDAFLELLRPVLAEGASPPLRVRTAPRRTRAFLKVEDGCDLSCSFCIIPSVRGRARSRAAAEVEAELRGLVEAGTPEIVLTGVHLGHYGRRAPVRLAELLRRLLRVPGSWRLRLSSLEVSELGPELLDLLAGEERLVPHLHLPLQSGSEAVLRRMRRPYTAAAFLRTVDQVRARLDDPALTTDVIVGFPGETASDFADTLAVCSHAAFARIHQFPYSPRAGTPAATLPDRVPAADVKARQRRLAAVEAESCARSLERRVGKTARVAVETVAPDGGLEGYDERYHRTRVYTAGTLPVGALVGARVVAVEDGRLRAEA